MDPQTKGELIERGTGLVASMLKSFVQNRAERQRREKDAELRKELAEIKFGDGATDGPETESQQPTATGSVGALDQALAEINDYDALLEQAADEETCPVCERMIRAVRDQPARLQDRMLPELRDFLDEKQGQVSKAELKRSLEDKPALLKLVETEFAE